MLRVAVLYLKLEDQGSTLELILRFQLYNWGLVRV